MEIRLENGDTMRTGITLLVLYGKVGHLEDPILCLVGRKAWNGFVEGGGACNKENNHHGHPYLSSDENRLKTKSIFDRFCS
jgi:hypothetical protein